MTEKADIVGYTFEIAEEGRKDLEYGTYRNTIRAVCQVCGAIVGGLIGAYCGSEVCVGFGTAAGGFVAGKVADWVMDSWKVGMQQKRCNLCKQPFYANSYAGEGDHQICNNCVCGRKPKSQPSVQIPKKTSFPPQNYRHFGYGVGG